MNRKVTFKDKKFLRIILVECAILGLIMVPSAIFFNICRFGEPGPLRAPDLWELKFVDNFNEPTLNTSIWTKNYPADWSDGGHTHNHRAYMDEDNVFIENGILRIRADNETHPNAPNPRDTSWGFLSYNFTAGCINSLNKLSFQFGYIEARMQMPNSNGFWPAFWTLNNDGGWPPEIDIHEYLSNNPQSIYTTVHWGVYGTSYESKGDKTDFNFNLWDDFHTYGLEWSPDHMIWYFDGKRIGKIFADKDAIAQFEAQYILINLAVAGWADDPDETTIWPAYYDTDYIKIWQLSGEFAEENQSLTIH